MKQRQEPQRQRQRQRQRHRDIEAETEIFGGFFFCVCVGRGGVGGEEESGCVVCSGGFGRERWRRARVEKRITGGERGTGSMANPTVMTMSTGC